MPTPVDPGRPLLVAGPGSIGRLPEVLSWWRPERVLLVGSRRAVAASSALGLLGDAAVTWFDAVRANPRWLQVAELVRLLERSRPDVVVALGGGSALDTAKLGRVLADPAPKPRPKLRKDPPRLVLVPTTGGSGAEMTRFAAVGTGRERRSLDHPALLADVAIVDPRLSDTCPPAVTYPAAFDALAHAIESYWSVRSTPETRALSWQATGDLVAALAAPLETPTPRQRNQLAAAATRAGRAVDATRTGAVEAFAGWLTAHRQVPHGVACLLTLSWLLPYNCRYLADGCADGRGPAFVAERLRSVCTLLGGPGGGPGGGPPGSPGAGPGGGPPGGPGGSPGGGPEPAADALSALVRAAGWSDRLGTYGLGPGTLPAFAAAGLRAANPVTLDPDRIAAAVQDRS